MTAPAVIVAVPEDQETSMRGLLVAVTVTFVLPVNIVTFPLPLREITFEPKARVKPAAALVKSRVPPIALVPIVIVPALVAARVIVSPATGTCGGIQLAVLELSQVPEPVHTNAAIIQLPLHEEY